MSIELTIHVEDQDGTVLVRPEGEVDLARSPSLRHRLMEVIGAGPTKLILNLTDVPYMDSSGVATLVEALQQCRGRNAELILAAMQPRVRSVFEIARLDTVFTICDDLQTAQES